MPNWNQPSLPRLFVSNFDHLDWADRGACGKNGHDPVLWFPVVPDHPSRAVIQAVRERVGEAKAICAGCPVNSDCLQFSLEHPQFGIWGGTTEDERDNIMRKRRRRAQYAREHRG